MKKMIAIKNWFFARSLLVKVLVAALIGGISWFAFSRFQTGTSQKPQYQTAQVERGTLVVSVSVSGQVASVNSAIVSTQASGVVKSVFAKNGEIVKAGTKIAEIDLDRDGQQRASQTLASYQSAKNTLASARATFYSLQSTMFTDWKTYMDIAQNSTYQNGDGSPRTEQRQLPEFMSTNDDWLFAEAKYKNQQGVVTQAQTALNAAWLSYQQSSPIVYAPISGTITGLSLQTGTVLTSQYGSSGNSTAQRIASVITEADPTVTLNLTEIDAPKVHVGDKATVTLDAFSGKTFTGSVVSVDTVGSIVSGVATYSSAIRLDSARDDIFPNMSAQASIITQKKDSVLLVPSSAIQNQNGETFVRTLKNGKPVQAPVVTGLFSDTQTEIVSGLSEGETIVTSSIVPNAASNGQQRTNQTTSPFSALRGSPFTGGGAGRGGGR